MLEYYKFNGVDQYTELETPTSGDFVWEVYGRFLEVNNAIGRSSSHSSVRIRHFGNAWAFSYGYLTHAGGTPDFDWHLFQVSIEGLRVDGVLVVPHPAPEPLPANDMPLTLGALNELGGAYVHGATEIIATAINGIPLDISSLSGGSPDNYSQTDGGSTKGLDALRNPITNDGGLVHNGADVKLMQDPDAWQLLDKVTLVLDGVEYDAILDAISTASKARYDYTDGFVMWAGSNWVLGGARSSVRPTADGQYPPKIGWPNTNDGKTFSIKYNSNWIDDDGNLIKRDIVNFLDTMNLTNEELIRWIKMFGGGCGVDEDMHYNQGATDSMTPEEIAEALEYARNDLGCGTSPNPSPQPDRSFSEGFSNGFS